MTSILSLVIIICTILLFQENKSSFQLKKQKKIGLVQFKNNTVERKQDGSVVWNKAENNTSLYEKDTIRTDFDSSVILNLSDGTEVRIDENTMVLIDLNDKESTIQLLKGNIRAIRTIKTEKPLNIHILEKIIAILDEGDINLKKSEDVSVNVNSGFAKLIQDSKEFFIKANEFFRIKKTGEVDLLSVAPVLVSPEDQKFFISKEKTLRIDFVWSSKNQNLKSRIDFSNDRSFKNIFFTKDVYENSYSKEFNYGTTYWRVIHSVKGKDEISLERKFTILKEEDQTVFFPTTNIKKTYSEFPKTVLFKWKENFLIKEYTIEISKDADFNSIVKTITTLQSQINVEFPEEGKYYYRFKLTFNHPDIPNKSTPIQSIDLKRNDNLVAPILLSPHDNTEIYHPSNTSLPIYFYWEDKDDFDSYKIQISNDYSFQRIYFEEIISASTYIFKKQIPEGKYFWRLIGNHNSKEAVYSKINIFTLKKEDIKIFLQSPENGVEIDSTKEDKFEFKWLTTELVEDFQFEISKNKNFTSKVLIQKVKKKNILISGLTIGSYYWRVLGLKGNMKSNIGYFKIWSNESIEAPSLEESDGTFFIEK
ncbi:MAG: FecR family protein [Leptospiraceae bacterium]|nr:FecR family protein [Leptospiraceae bacterium]